MLLQEDFASKYDWVCTTENVDGKPLLRFLDHHHLLTNCRLHCCRSGFPLMGIGKYAWLKVAKENKTNKSGLNIAYVEDLIDPQSNAVAQLTFSTKVEDCMRQNNCTEEANFCSLIRNWYQAVDARGLTALERVQKLLMLREFLLDKTSGALNRFPPPGKHISDMSVVLFTGLIISCERLIQLYKVCKTGRFNVRSIGSLDNETFFSLFRDLDPRGEGVLTPSQIPKAMSVSCQLLTTRLNPERGYFFKTTTKFPVFKEDQMETSVETFITCNDSTDTTSESLFRSHPHFDGPIKIPSKRKCANISTLEESAHGARGIRQHHRRDEEKILPHKRACIDLN